MFAYLIRGFAVLALTALLAAPARADDTPLLVPTSGWLVGPSTLSADGTDGLPCVMTNQFNNGFTLRLSGGNGRILGFVLDVRQKLFDAGTAQDMTLSIAPGYRQTVKAEAYDAATLMANMQAAPGFYEALDDTRSLTVDLGQGRNVEFVMLGVKDGLKRLEACFDPGAQPQRSDAAQAAPRQQTISAATPRPQGGNAAAQSLPSRDAAELAQQAAPPISAPYTARSGGQPAAHGTTRAAPEKSAEETGGVAAAYQELLGERLSIDGENPRAGMKSGAPAVTETADPTRRMAPEGTQRDQLMQKMIEEATKAVREDVVSQVAAQRAAAVAPAAGNTQAAVRPTGAQRAATTMAAINSSKARPAEDPVADMGRHWHAPAGASLREVLYGWAQKADARLIWQAQGNFTLPATLTAQGSFESAAGSALKQFQGEARPPLGQIYYDEERGQKVLLVTQP